MEQAKRIWLPQIRLLPYPHVSITHFWTDLVTVNEHFQSPKNVFVLEPVEQEIITITTSIPCKNFPEHCCGDHENNNPK